ncbi:MAG TPA: DNA double-strand break repair nuclease NurA [Pyrinomonadaceae bacterium]|nr:DNA double-strand break repair nuclease NurA [Pyrinomonadaceae bacterium]
MLYRPHLNAQLRERRDEFVRFEAVWNEALGEYVRRLRALGGRASGEIKSAAERAIAAGAARAAGALPADELERAGAFVVAFKERWRSHEEARRWAVEVLTGRVTCAADGSQILPGREISLPVAAVQAAWFENPHTAAGQDSYRKESRFSIITPEELLKAEGGAATAADLVGLRRFQLEIAALSEFLERQRGWRARGERLPVAFFDGTLLLSTTRTRAESLAGALDLPGAYIKAIVEAVRLSRDTEVPLVGYIDQSYARDIVRLLDLFATGEPPPAATVFDARLFSASNSTGGEPLFNSWGDRTVFCYCVREGLTADFQDERGNPLVGFVYLQTTGEGAPARLDIPAWVYEKKLIDEVVNTVRAECVVGNGYPYALETADAAAVITMQDREQFLRAMQEFAAEQNLGFQVSRKPISKAHRR